MQAPVLRARDTRGLSVLVKDASGINQALRVYDRMFALIVGIDRYRTATPLANAVGDARGVKKVLQEQCAFDAIEELYDEQATRERILAGRYVPDRSTWPPETS